MGAPDEFHADAPPEAREITGNRQYGEWGQCIATAKSAGRRCRGYAQGPHGKCSTHGGAEGSGAPEGNNNAEGNGGGGAPEGNNNAVDHAAYSEDYLEDFMSERERARIEDGFEVLETPEGAQDIARVVALMALEQFRRSGDERFMRRFESICDKAEIFPSDALEVSGDLGIEELHMENLREYYGDDDE